MKFMDIETIYNEGMQKYKDNEVKTFSALINGIEEEKRYNDINYVNFWIDKEGNPIYKVYLMNGESVFLANNLEFDTELLPMRINVINEVVKKEYL